MTDIFIKLSEMSVTASAAVIIILLIRPFMRKTPKYIRCILWSVVGLRLCLPFALETEISPMPHNHAVTNAVYSKTANTAVRITAENTERSLFSADKLTVIWLCGVAVMSVYALISYISLRRKVSPSLRDGEVYICDNISVPFILGIILPKIYIPSGMKTSERKHVVAHETAHIKRCDHLIKPFAFLLLSVYWFNPVIWAGYVFLCRDIELACDESVIKLMNKNDAADYSVTLLNYSSDRRAITVCPVAFGEVAVKIRIKSILNYKKPALWVTVVSLVVCIAITVCFFTAKPENNKPFTGNTMTVGVPVIFDEKEEKSDIVELSENTMASDTVKDVKILSETGTEKKPQTAPKSVKSTVTCAHEYERTVHSAVCTENGWEKTVCVLCGEEKTSVIPALGHSYTESTVAPSCTESGYVTYICKTCGYTYKGDTIPATGHNYRESVIESSCVSPGAVYYICDTCGDTYKSDTVPPVTTHSIVYNGNIAYCRDCGYIAADETTKQYEKMSNPAVDWDALNIDFNSSLAVPAYGTESNNSGTKIPTERNKE